jgi:hypothetical protein
MAYLTRVSRRPNIHFCFSQHCVWQNFAQFFYQFFNLFISTMTSTLELVVETPEMVTEVNVHGTLDKQPVKTHKSKKHVKDRNMAGRASMVPPSLDQPSKHASLDFAEDKTCVLGRNTLCTSTFPGENQRPPSCPQRGSGADQGDDWQVYNSPYGQPYNDGSYYGDSWHRKPHRCVTPYYDNRRFEEHAPLPYRHQPSSPYRSSFYVPPRHRRASFMDVFKDVNAFQDVMQCEVNKVSFSFLMILKNFKNPHPRAAAQKKPAPQ